MGLGNKHYDQNGKLFVLKIKTKDADGQEVPPFFQISEKVGDKWQVVEKTINSVSGLLEKVEVKEKEFNGDVIKSTSVYLKEGDETYLLDIRYSILGRSILNSLINIKDTGLVTEISLYTNKKGYSAAAVRSGDDIVSWKFSLDEQPKPDELKDKKGNLVKRDYSEVDEFFDKYVTEFGDVLAGGEPAAEEEPKKAPAKTKKTKEVAVPAEEPAGDPDDEVGF